MFLFFISGVLIGLVPLTRYVGIAIVLAGGVTVLLFTSGKTRQRIGKAALFTLVSGLPIIIWLAWVYLFANRGIAGRTLDIDASTFSSLFKTFRISFIDTVWKWLPYSGNILHNRYGVRFIWMAIGALAIVTFSLLAGRKLRKEAISNQRTLMANFAFFGFSALAYVIVLFASYILTRPIVAVDERMFLPLYVCCVMSIYGAFALWQTAWPMGWKRLFQVIPWLTAALCLAWYIPQTRRVVNDYHPGDGLTAYHWGRSDIIQAVGALSPQVPVISNDWELLMLWTGRPVYSLWNTFPTALPIQTTAYGTNQSDLAQSVFCEQNAALVIFNDFPTQFSDQIDGSSLEPLPKLFDGLSIYGNYSDGIIYFCH